MHNITEFDPKKNVKKTLKNVKLITVSVCIRATWEAARISV